MSGAKRAPRKSAPPSLPVPRVRTLRSEDDYAPVSPPREWGAEPRKVAARRTRRPKFVF